MFVFASCSGMSKEQVWGNFIRAKWLIIYCQFLYIFFYIFLFIIIVLCLFQCFRIILERNGRKVLKRVENRQIWQKSMQQGNPGQFGRPDWIVFSFFGSIDIGQLGKSCFGLFAYLRRFKTHPQGIQNHSHSKIKERIKRRRSSCSQDSEFLHNFCNCYQFLLLFSSQLVFNIS